MKVLHLDHVNFTVTDFDESVSWYHRVLGFEIVEEEITDGIRWGIIRSGEALLAIYEHPQSQYLDRFELRDRGLHGMAHFSVRIDDEQEWLEVVEREQLKILYDGVIEWSHSRSWYINDPTGYEIEIALWNDDRIQFKAERVD